MGRRAARESAMKLLYQIEFHKDNREAQLSALISSSSLNDNDKLFISGVTEGVHNNLAQIDSLIRKFSKGWRINRISKIDLSILRLCIYEIMHIPEIPYSVSVNEAVELSKKYSSIEASAFVNGILSKIIKPEDNPGGSDVRGEMIRHE
jgi:transcription antitermination protein NusB